MNVFKKLPFVFGAVLLSTSALANPQQIAVAKKAVIAGEVMPYATPSLKKLLNQAYQIGGEFEGVQCEFGEHWYLGHGQDDWVTVQRDVKNAKITTPKANTVRMVVKSGGIIHLIEFSMAGNKINDVKSGVSYTKTPPTKTEGLSLRATAQKMVEIDDCVN